MLAFEQICSNKFQQEQLFRLVIYPRWVFRPCVRFERKLTDMTDEIFYSIILNQFNATYLLF